MKNQAHLQINPKQTFPKLLILLFIHDGNINILRIESKVPGMHINLFRTRNPI